MYKLALWKWQEPQERELHDTRVSNYHPQHHTGMKVWCWGGWAWEANGIRRRTDSTGGGLWQSDNNGCYQQISGTCQFSLPENRQAAIRKLRRLGYDIKRR